LTILGKYYLFIVGNMHSYASADFG
jgi:hypothetical protein